MVKMAIMNVINFLTMISSPVLIIGGHQIAEEVLRFFNPISVKP